MSTNVGDINLDLVLQSQPFRQQLQQSVNRAVKDANKQLGTVGGAGTALTGTFKTLGGVIAGAFAVSKITSFAKECLSLGSDLAEVQNVVNVTFETMSGDIDAFAKNAAKQFGLSETMAKKYAGTYGSMADAFGFTEQQALNMSEALTGLTGDVASFYNITQDEAYTKLKSVFSGETESLKDLGVVMTQDALDAYALANGYGKTVSQMSEMEKVSLRYAFVSEKLANAQGDYARTSNGWANSTRTLALQFDALKAELGQGLINVFSPIVQWLNTIIERLTAASTKFKEFTAAVMGVSPDISSGTSAAAASTEILNSSLADTESTAKSAAKAMRDLMGFDEINRLSDNSTDAGTSAASTVATPISAASSSGNDDTSMISALEAPLKRIKDLWNELYSSFKKGLKARLDAGDVTKALDSIRNSFKNIKDALKDIFTDGDVLRSAKYLGNQIAEFFGSLVGNFLSIGVNLADALLKGISTFLDEKKEFLQEKIASIFQTTGDIFGSLTAIMNDVTDIINYILQLPETARVIADAINIAITPLVTWADLALKIIRDNLSGLSQVVQDNKDGFMVIGEVVVGFFADVMGAVSDFIDAICAKAEAVYEQYIQPAIQNIWDGINSLVSFLIGIWQQYISPFLEQIGEDVKELFQQHITPLVEKFMEYGGKLMELISVLWKKYVEPFIEWWVSNMAPVILPVLREIWALVKLVVRDIIDHVKRVLEILGGLLDFLIGVFTGDWDRAWEGIKEIFSGVIGLFTDKLDNLMTFLGDTFENIGTSIEQIFGRIKDAAHSLLLKIQEKFNQIKTFFSGFWEAVKQIFSDPKSYFKEKFSAAADGIKEAFSGIQEWFGRLWDDLVTALKSPVNSIIDILNYLISKINTLSFSIPDWVPEFGGQTFGFSIPEIPHLATGGYVKANTPQLAVIGDNRREGEIVAPESKIAEAVAKAMQMVLSRLDSTGGTGQPQGETVLQANIWLGNDLLAKKLTKLQKVNDYRSGGLA